jgi:hypothetical protein
VLSGDPARPSDWLKPVRGRPEEFAATGVAGRVRFMPFYRVVHEPYGIYWPVLGPQSERAKQIRAEAAQDAQFRSRQIDGLVPGREEAAHMLKSQGSHSGRFGGVAWRDADTGGWWSWDMKVLPDVQMTLSVIYWGSDFGPRTFDILVDGTVVATQRLDRANPDRFFHVEYELPAALTQGKTSVTVKFQPHPGNTAGGVFGCRMLKPQ